jgi:uncharacterized protein (DUF3820 family)
MSFSFGKFKGKSVEEVASQDIGYLRWVSETCGAWNKPPSPALMTAIKAVLDRQNTGPGVVTRVASAASSSSASGPVSLLLGAIAPRPAVGASVPATSGEPVISFGKYKGQGLSVLVNDKPYATWCLQQDFFKRNVLYSKVAAALNLPVEKEVVTTIYSSGSSGISVPGDGGTVAFGKYKGQPLSAMLVNSDYCRWVVGAAASWDKKPRNYDQIVAVAAKAGDKKSSGRPEDDAWEPPEEDYEIDDAPLEVDEEEGEIDDAPLEDPDDEGEIDDAPMEDPDE